MRLYLDTEFNGHGGKLISMAFAASEGPDWYGIKYIPKMVESWVAANVIPQLDKLPRTCTPPYFRHSLIHYLQAREGCEIIADWPADFELLMREMCSPGYGSSWYMPCTLRLVQGVDPKPAIPHNALSDARALRACFPCA